MTCAFTLEGGAQGVKKDGGAGREKAAPSRLSPKYSSRYREKFPVSLLGSYLAGRAAQKQRDVKNAAFFFRRALERDPDNESLLLQSLVLDISAGQWDGVRERAELVLEKKKGQALASLVMGIVSFEEGDYRKARKYFVDSGKSPISLLVSILAEAWTYRAEGQSELALATLNKLDRLSWAKFYQGYHKALISDISGSRKRAGKIYAGLFAKEARTLRLTLAYVRHLSSIGRRRQALKVLNKHLEVANLHPLAEKLGEELESGKRLKRFINIPQEGLAEVFYGVGDALTSEGGVDIGTIYLQIALHLRPDFPMAQLALAEVFEDAKRYDLSNQAYGHIGEDSPLWASVVIRKAFNLNAEKRVDEARLLLDQLIAVEPDNIDALEAQGNILRAHKRFKEAVDYMSRAIALLKDPEEDDWKYFYSRGVSYEQLKIWPKAEKDFLMALKLKPEEPLVLNYLGYSWVDKGLHLKRAMDLIRKAVSKKPNDGYFVDSLGWAYYRLGNYQKSVGLLERAVSLKADDPIINDHLGDVYWRVGRRLEAKYQWQQALDLKATEEDAKKIREKLAKGLPEHAHKKVATIAESLGNISNAVAPKKAVPAVSRSVKEPVKEEATGEATTTSVGDEDENFIIYEVRRGDTLWKLSKKFFGTGQKYKAIYKVNRNVIGRRGRLYKGMRLRIPKL